MLNHEKTAITRGSSKSAKLLSRTIAKHEDVLDFGAGKLRNSMLLKQRGFENVYALDTAKQVAGCKDTGGIPFSTYENYKDNRFEAILCSFVLNVCSPEEQAMVVDQIKSLSMDGTRIIFEVRTVRDVKGAKTAQSDGQGGFVMRGGTYQYPFTVRSLRDLLEDDFCIEQVREYSGSIVITCTVEGESNA
jgi:hypothetical protein